MKLVAFITSTCLILIPMSAYSAWNWNGRLKTKVQADNRYSRYTDETRTFGEIWGNVEVFDNKSWRLALDFVSRESVETGFEAEIFQLYVEKEFVSLDGQIKIGRFQRADSLGFYSLDGADVQYKMPDKGLRFNFYAGRPIRQEDVRSVSGEWLYGFELHSFQMVNWQNSILPIDTWSTRIGFQQFHSQYTSTQLSVGNVLQGQFQHDYLYAYELSFMATLDAENGTFEELLSSVALDVTESSRIRLNYAIYEPKLFFPTFKERFYSSYYQGKQDLLSLNFTQSINSTFSYHVGGKRAEREGKKYIGYGFDTGLKSDYFSDWRLTADFDMLEFGESSSYNLYFSSQYSLSTQTLVTLNLAYSLDKSALYDENKAAGTELKFRYKVL